LNLKYMRALFRHYVIKSREAFSQTINRCLTFFSFSRYIFRRSLNKVTLLMGRESPYSPGDAPINFQTFFINLNRRKDRRKLIETELADRPFKRVMRVQAVSTSDGHLGAAKSHAAALKYAIWNDLETFMVIEDDGQFTVDNSLLLGAIREFLGNRALDVLMLGNNPRTPPIKISPKLSITSNSTSAGCYLVKSQAYSALERSLGLSITLLENGCAPEAAAFDQIWKRDQAFRLCVAVPNSLTFRQRLSYSDTQGRLIEWPPSEGR
jgi:hypothetical protein